MKIFSIPVLGSVAIVAILVAVPWYMQENLSGSKPTVQYDTYMREQVRSENFDEELKALSKAAESNPKDIKSWKALSNKLADKIYSSQSEPPQGMILELIDSLRHVLEIEPGDPETLLNMANLNYNFQVFDKAAEYFEQYLKVAKEDHTSRATYASALSFLGNFDEAEKELLYVIAKEPTHFLARANLAISYALAGNKEATKKASTEALKYAKDEETGKKFSQFIEQILAPKTQQVDNSAPTEMPRPSGEFTNLEASIRSNPVAGPKFVFAKAGADKTIELHFANFPMKAMPPFAREKFLSGIKDAIKKEGLEQKYNEVKFMDHGTGETLDSFKIE